MANELDCAPAKRGQEAGIAKKREEIRESIESYNRLIERAGVFGEEFQEWDAPSNAKSVCS